MDLTPRTWGVEQYTISINHYASTTDLNMVTSRVGIASQFLQNAYVNGEQAARSLDELARNALFAPYFGGNTRVRLTLGSAGPAVSVDDVRGFQNVFNNGVQTPVSAHLSAHGNHRVRRLHPDRHHRRRHQRVHDARRTLGRTHPFRQRHCQRCHRRKCRAGRQRQRDHPSQRPHHHHGARRHGHTRDGQSARRGRQIAGERRPDIEGVYNCYLDPVSARRLFADQDFQRLFQGATSANQVFKQGMINDFLGLRFIPTTEAYIQPPPTIAGAVIRRPIICGQGPLSRAISPAWPPKTWRRRTLSCRWSTASPWSPASRSTDCSRSSHNPGIGSAASGP